MGLTVKQLSEQTDAKFAEMQAMLGTIAAAVTGEAQAPVPVAEAPTPTQEVAAAALPATNGQVWLHEEVRNVQSGEVSQGKRLGYVTRKAGSLVFIPTAADGTYKLSEKNQHKIRGAHTIQMPLLKLAQSGGLNDLITAAESA